MAWAARNGFYYLLDRNNGQFLLAKNFVRQTWVKGFDDKGRPASDPRQRSDAGGQRHRVPGRGRRRELDVAQLQPADQAVLRLRPRRAARVHQEHRSGMRPRRTTRRRRPASARRARTAARRPTASSAPAAICRRPVAAAAELRFAPEESWGKVVAIDPLSGEIKWEHKVITPPWGGVMSTAGNLVFGGTQEGVVFALDARTGERLWYFAGNERVYASPISYLANGKQYVSLAVGDVLVTFGL